MPPTVGESLQIGPDIVRTPHDQVLVAVAQDNRGTARASVHPEGRRPGGNRKDRRQPHALQQHEQRPDNRLRKRYRARDDDDPAIPDQ